MYSCRVYLSQMLDYLWFASILPDFYLIIESEDFKKKLKTLTCSSFLVTFPLPTISALNSLNQAIM